MFSPEFCHNSRYSGLQITVFLSKHFVKNLADSVHHLFSHCVKKRLHFYLFINKKNFFKPSCKNGTAHSRRNSVDSLFKCIVLTYKTEFKKERRKKVPVAVPEWCSVVGTCIMSSGLKGLSTRGRKEVGQTWKLLAPVTSIYRVYMNQYKCSLILYTKSPYSQQAKDPRTNGTLAGRKSLECLQQMQSSVVIQ